MKLTKSTLGELLRCTLEVHLIDKMLINRARKVFVFISDCTVFQPTELNASGHKTYSTRLFVVFTEAFAERSYLHEFPAVFEQRQSFT